ncbi:MAG: AAA family ATPase [bacterium]|nr:MAG: AAA family ATPase [bacterium]
MVRPGNPDHGRHPPIHLGGIGISHDRYPTRDHHPFNLEILQNTSRLIFSSPVTFFAGENGSGKSTLLRGICLSCGIHIWESERRRRLEPNRYEGRLHEAIDVQWSSQGVPGAFFASEIFRDFSQALDEFAAADPGFLRYFGGRSLVSQSHGQSIMSYFRSRCRIEGLYLLDEPETALSPRSQIQLLRILAGACRGGGAQFIIASHSPILLSCPGALIYSFDGDAVEPISYEETDHYRVYHDFMLDRNRYLAGP